MIFDVDHDDKNGKFDCITLFTYKISDLVINKLVILQIVWKSHYKNSNI